MTSMKSCWLCAKVVNSISRNFFSLQSCIHKGRNHHTYSCVKVVPAGKNWYLTCEIPEFISRINPHISHLSIIWGRCYLKRSRRTVIFLPDYKISSLKIILPKTLQLKTGFLAADDHNVFLLFSRCFNHFICYSRTDCLVLYVTWRPFVFLNQFDLNLFMKTTENSSIFRLLTKESMLLTSATFLIEKRS